MQLQFLQIKPFEKHSQYNFKHFEFLHLQGKNSSLFEIDVFVFVE
jgi:hypothetical protein